MRTPAQGFTLIEILVAVALVATALGGVLAAVREAIAIRQHLEQRLFAHWVADNVLNQFVLEADSIEPLALHGEEVLMGRRYAYVLAVSMPEVTARGEGLDGYDATVEVHGPDMSSTSLAHGTRHIVTGAGR